jgi:hypothetical protein
VREPLEERATDLVLERLDLVRERRLGDVQPPCGARERSLVDDGREVDELAKVQVTSIIDPVYQADLELVFALSSRPAYRQVTRPRRNRDVGR